MKILVIGSGGREHALAHTFHRQGHTVFCLPGNTGTDLFCDTITNPCSISDHKGLTEIVRTHGINLTVVGPEAALSEGVVDYFLKHNLPIFGPTKNAAKLESEKAFAKQFMHTHKIPTARFVTCTDSGEALEVVHKYFKEWGGVVIKPSGLTAGKGVMCCKSLIEAELAVDVIMKQQNYGEAGQEVVIEEMIEGQEVSILAFCDGTDMITMIPSQDHKRLLDHDQGPNTGGMGAYTPLPFIQEDDLHTIQKDLIDVTNRGLKNEGIDYRGILYFGIMMTKQGPKVLEFNCRFGDPEAQVVLPLIESDLAAIMYACYNGTLKEQTVTFSSKSACGVVMASGGYPLKYETDYVIKGLETLDKKDDLFCFHAGTKKDSKGNTVTAGGRVLCVTALGNTLEEAIQKAYKGIKRVSFQDAHYREDIANKALVQR